jgi:hypothetical protein
MEAGDAAKINNTETGQAAKIKRNKDALALSSPALHLPRDKGFFSRLKTTFRKSESAPVIHVPKSVGGPPIDPWYHEDAKDLSQVDATLYICALCSIGYIFDYILLCLENFICRRSFPDQGSRRMRGP